MCDEDVVSKVSKMFGTACIKHTPKNPKHKDTYITALRGSRARKLMTVLKPLMGQRRQIQIQKALDSHDPNKGRKITLEQIQEILTRPEEDAKKLALEYGISKWYIYLLRRTKEKV